ncbi:uncharacterized protein LOC124374198 [Homalodisca vitripennis]|uniref:uncharacterized protein LOC124374198 n=1 Tax=Homalodisca vitripennis TaxID=197043 RepID=UPI001EECED55|nr:uncharacterized protein LOC124374198 [Homalodisca vitripennis]
MKQQSWHIKGWLQSPQALCIPGVQTCWRPRQEKFRCQPQYVLSTSPVPLPQSCKILINRHLTLHLLIINTSNVLSPPAGNLGMFSFGKDTSQNSCDKQMEKQKSPDGGFNFNFMSGPSSSSSSFFSLF